jgi:hypothetical protein
MQKNGLRPVFLPYPVRVPSFENHTVVLLDTKNMDKNKNLYKTTSFYAAAFLCAKGLKLIGIDKPLDSKKACFVFEDSPKRADLLESFNFGEESNPKVIVDARKFIGAIKTLKDKLYQS